MMISFAFLGGSKEAILTVYARQPDQEYLDMIPMYQKHNSFFFILVPIIFAKIFSFKAATYNAILKFDAMNSFRFLADGIWHLHLIVTFAFFLLHSNYVIELK